MALGGRNSNIKRLDRKYYAANFNRLLSSAFLGVVENLRKATISFVTSVRSSVCMSNSAPTGRIFTKLYE